MTSETYDIPKLRKALQAAKVENDLARSSLLLGMLGRAALQSQKVLEAITDFEKAISLARQVGDQTAEARHQANLGVAYSQIGNYKQAARSLRRAQKLALQIGDQELICDTLVQLAYLDSQREEYADAMVNLEQALEISGDLQDPKRRMRIHGLQGEIQMLLGEIEAADQNYQAALKLAQEQNDLAEEGAYVIGAVQSLCAHQEYRRAIPWIQRALAWAGASDLERVPGLWAQLGEIHEQSGDLEEARAAYRRCLDLANTDEWLALQTKVYGKLSTVESELGNSMESLTCAKKAISLAEASGKPELYSEAAVHLMFAYLEADDLENARDAGNQAIAVYRGLDQPQMVEIVQKTINSIL